WISPTSTSTYRIGVSNGATLTAINTPTSDYALGEEIFIEFNYDIDNDMINALINPTLGGSEPVEDINEVSNTSANTISKFLIIQISSFESPTIVMYELRIVYLWAHVSSNTLSISQADATTFKVYPNPTSSGF